MNALVSRFHASAVNPSIVWSGQDTHRHTDTQNGQLAACRLAGRWQAPAAKHNCATTSRDKDRKVGAGELAHGALIVIISNGSGLFDG